MFLLLHPLPDGDRFLAADAPVLPQVRLPPLELFRGRGDDVPERDARERAGMQPVVQDIAELLADVLAVIVPYGLDDLVRLLLQLLDISGETPLPHPGVPTRALPRSEEHTSELQSQFHLVCRV